MYIFWLIFRVSFEFPPDTCNKDTEISQVFASRNEYIDPYILHVLLFIIYLISINIILEKKTLWRVTVISTSFSQFEMVFTLLAKSMIMYVKLTKILIGKISLQKIARLVIKSFFSTHTDLQKSLQLGFGINNEA